MGKAAKNLQNETENTTLQIMKSMEFFSYFSDEHLEKLSTVVELRDYADDEVVLEQRQINHKVFFLVSGSVCVIVDGQEVAKLDNPGDVIGEMSVISAEPTSAEIRSSGDSTWLTINGSDIADVAGEKKEAIEAIIFRLYSLILVGKLVNTNQKAKRVEETFKELKKAQKALQEINVDLEEKVEERTRDLKESNNELSASYDKLSELVAARRFAFESVDQLYENFLPELDSNLNEVARFLSGDVRRKVMEVQRQVSMVFRVIQPIAEQSKEQRTIESKQVLIVESNRKQQIIIRMALGGSGVDVKVANELDEAKVMLEQGEFDLVLASTANTGVLLTAKTLLPKAKVVLLASSNIKEYLPLLEIHPEINNVVSRNEEDRFFTTRHVLATVGKLLSGEIFGLEKYMAWGVDVFQWKVTNSHMRRDLIEQMNEKLRHLGVRPSFLERCSLVAEEMLMNAIYDAPTDENGNAKYNHMDRREVIELLPNEQSSLRVACDGSFLAVSVVDPFGALKKEEILKYLRSCYEGRAGIFNKKKGGAGRGLHQIVESSDLVIFNVRQGIRTEVIALFYLDQKQRPEGHETAFHFFFD